MVAGLARSNPIVERISAAAKIRQLVVNRPILNFNHTLAVMTNTVLAVV